MNPLRIGLALFLFGIPAIAAVEPPVLRAPLESEPTTLDWSFAQTASDRFIASFLMRGMLKYGDDARLICDLCKSFSVSDDQKTLRFEIQEDVLWSDGKKLESRQFVDAFQRLRTAPEGTVDARFKAIQTVKSDGERGLEITLLRPSSTFIHLMTTPMAFPIRKETIGKVGDRGRAHATGYVLGPYQLAEWEKGQRIVLEGNPKYTGSRPVYRVDFLITSHSKAAEKFKTGKLDILTHPSTEDVLKSQGRALRVCPYWATRSLIFNVMSGPSAELNLRRAFLYALNREELPSILKNGEQKATGILPPGLSGFRGLALAGHDLARARTEWESIASKFRKEPIEFLTLDSEQDQKVARWVVGSLTPALPGLNLKLVTLDEEGYRKRLRSGKFGIALSILAAELATPLDLLSRFRTQDARNFGGWSNLGYDELLNHLETPKKDASHQDWNSTLDQAMQIVEAQAVAAIPLGYPIQPYLLGKRVSNFATTPFGEPDLVRIELKH